MDDRSISHDSIRALRKMLGLFAVCAFAVCQIVCLSHFHSLDLIHLGHHHHAPDLHLAGHGDEHEEDECDDCGCAFTDYHGHAGPDHTIVPTRLALWWPEIGITGIESPVSMVSSRAVEHHTTSGARSLIDLHGFTFIGRSPTAS